MEKHRVTKQEEGREKLIKRGGWERGRKVEVCHLFKLSPLSLQLHLSDF